MFSMRVHFQETASGQPQSSLVGALTTLIIILTLHYSDNVKNVGQLEYILIPALLTITDAIKGFYLKGLPIIGRSFKWIILKSMLLIGISIAMFFILAILYGAPAFSKHEQTCMFAIYLTVCSTIHCLINMGFKDFMLMLTKPNNSNTVVLNSAQIVASLSIMGCWASAIVIPLDWDRWWQKWPIPSVMGTLIGCNIGHTLSVLLIYHHRKKDKRMNV